MKKFEIKLVTGYNKIIAILLTVLGFSSSCEDVLHPRAEYGVPHGDFIIKGAVESAINNTKIPNIQVVLDDTSQFGDVYADTTYSSSDGKYEVKISAFPDSRMLKLTFKDVDGLQNSVYLSKDSLVEFKDPQFTGGEHWYSGSVTKEVNVKLTPVK